MNKLFITPVLMDGIGTLNAAVKNMAKQMGISDPHEVLRRINSKEWVVAENEREWTEEDGVIRFSVTSDGTTGEEWITRLEDKAYGVSDHTKSLLKSTDFKLTSAVITEIAVLKGDTFKDNGIKDSDLITEKIRSKAKKINLTTPNAEIACLIREKFTNDEIKDMGLYWIVTMHEPIRHADGDLLLFGTGRNDDGWLITHYGKPGGMWDRKFGFAFVASQVSP